MEFGIFYYVVKHFAMKFCAGNLNECPFTTKMSIYFRFSKNGHSLCQKK
jgi:hypothetical protein